MFETGSSAVLDEAALNVRLFGVSRSVEMIDIKEGVPWETVISARPLRLGARFIGVNVVTKVFVAPARSSCRVVTSEMVAVPELTARTVTVKFVPVASRGVIWILALGTTDVALENEFVKV